MSGADDMEQRIDQWAARARETAIRYQNLTTAMNTITGHAVGARGAITVEVNHTGVLTRLDLTDDTRTMRPHHLAGEIMKTIAHAQATLGDQITTLMREHVPGDETAIATVAGSYSRLFPEPGIDTHSTNTANEDWDEDFGGNFMH